MKSSFDAKRWQEQGLKFFEHEGVFQQTFKVIAHFVEESPRPLRLPYALEWVKKRGVMAVFQRPDSPLRFREAEQVVLTIQATYPDATIEHLHQVLKMLSGPPPLMNSELYQLDPSTDGVTVVEQAALIDLMRRCFSKEESVQTQACRELECLYLEYEPLLPEDH